jgi:hypothetical protein
MKSRNIKKLRINSEFYAEYVENRNLKAWRINLNNRLQLRSHDA